MLCLINLVSQIEKRFALHFLCSYSVLAAEDQVTTFDYDSQLKRVSITIYIYQWK